jgi:hypothetical protein
MTTPTHTDAFTDVINDLMKELHTLPHNANILHLLTNNLGSPTLAGIQHLSLSHLNTHQMTTLLPALGEMAGLASRVATL